MNIKTKYIPLFILAACCLILAACSKMDEYKDFSAGKEILYTGKPDSVLALSGKKRIQLSWLRSADPKVVKTRIYWNNRTDSMDVPVNSSGTRRLSTIINLPEGNYNFELFSFDSQGNRSVVSRASGVAYGDVYEKTLLNRGITGFGKQFDLEGSTVINWIASEAKSIGVELIYRDNSGADQKVIVNPSALTTILSNYNANIPVSYRTMFLPDSTAIDTFYSAAAPKSVSNQVLIKNSGYPFKAAKTVGRWGDAADWITTAPIKNQGGGVGGLDNLNTAVENYMSLEFWGNPAIINGKVYQTGTLAPGSYRFVVTISNINNNLEDTHLSVMKGTVLPDVANVSQSLISLKLTNSSMNNKDQTLAFTLTQTEVISLGVVSTMQKVNESSLRIKQFRLFKD